MAACSVRLAVVAWQWSRRRRTGRRLVLAFPVVGVNLWIAVGTAKSLAAVARMSWAAAAFRRGAARTQAMREAAAWREGAAARRAEVPLRGEAALIGAAMERAAAEVDRLRRETSESKRKAAADKRQQILRSMGMAVSPEAAGASGKAKMGSGGKNKVIIAGGAAASAAASAAAATPSRA